MEQLGSIPIQDGGRVMPLDTFARNLAAQLTGRTSWAPGKGPDAFSGKHHIVLFCDLLFQPMQVVHKTLLTIESRPFKSKVGLDPARRFFAPNEITGNQAIEKILLEYQQAKAKNANHSPTRDQRVALDLQGAIKRLSDFLDGNPLPVVPKPGQREFLRAGPMRGDPGTQPVCAAWSSLAAAYFDKADLTAPVQNLLDAIHASGQLDEASAKALRLETFYNHHRPWRMATYAYALSLILFGLSRLFAPKVLVPLALLAALWGVAEQSLGLSLRVLILARAPVSNTYEALLWMGLVAILLGLVAQLINRKAWYLFAGVAVAELCVLFSALVPLESRTTTLPAVLRSNYWLIVHVLTIVASYGILAVASLLGHIYLAKEVLFARKASTSTPPPHTSHPLIVQTYRSIQIGLFLLTAGTILGGVWAADSWGRFWGWDPKETWALISIIVYFAVLHARYIRWLRDFGLAASAVIGFALIVWTFYGVNYLMASGLHSYGFGSGGGTWVALWAIAEAIFIIACKVRHRSLASNGPAPQAPATSPDPASLAPTH